jgi:chromosome segregation ATPase
MSTLSKKGRDGALSPSKHEDSHMKPHRYVILLFLLLFPVTSFLQSINAPPILKENDLASALLSIETGDQAARRAGAEAQKKEAQKNLDVELTRPESQRCAACISDLKQEITGCELLITQLDAEISRLQADIVTRTKKYNVVLDERAKFGEQVQSANDAWQKFNIDKDALDKLLAQIEGRDVQPQP